MDRYQKPSDKLPDKKLFGLDLLGRWQKKMDSSIDQYIRRDLDDAELLLVPLDLQTCDPSLMGEISSGHFGLDGMFVEVGEGKPSVFAAMDADDHFNRALHGFGWLRDLRDQDDHVASAEAQRLVFEWIADYSQHESIAYEPEVLARRIISFLSNGPMILSGIGKKKTWRFMRVLSQQIAVLQYKLDETPGGLPRLAVLGALVMAGLCLSKHNKVLVQATELLLVELGKQILKDGGHCSRNPGAILQILFDILPLKQCFTGRGQVVPKELDQAITRMISMIRFFRMGDSSLARFNGQSTTSTNALATLLVQEESQDKRKKKPFEMARNSHYCRLREGPLTLLCDVGSPPSLQIMSKAHAGCLSFEMSLRHFALVVNSGAYMGSDEHWRRYARSTTAHSTLTIDHHSSSGFLTTGQLLGPHEVVVDDSQPLSFTAFHKGYEKRYGLTHQRTLKLSHKGLRLEGVDRLIGPDGPALHGTLRPDVSYQIRFHLHPFIELAQSDEDNLLMTLPDGEIWRFTATGASVNMQDSVYLAYRRGPEPAHQIILEGKANVETNVNWTFEQYRPRPDAP